MRDVIQLVKSEKLPRPRVALSYRAKPAPVHAPINIASTADGRESERRSASARMIATGISLTNSSVKGTQTATANTLEVPKCSIIGRPTKRARPVIARKPASAVPADARQLSVRTGFVTTIIIVIVHNCAHMSTRNLWIPAAWVMRGSEATSVRTAMARPMFDITCMVFIRLGDDADLAA